MPRAPLRVGTWIFWPRRGRDRRMRGKENGHQRVVPAISHDQPRNSLETSSLFFPLPYVYIYIHLPFPPPLRLLFIFPLSSKFLSSDRVFIRFTARFESFPLDWTRFKKLASWKIREFPKSPFSKDNRDDGDCRGGRQTIERGLS